MHDSKLFDTSDVVLAQTAESPLFRIKEEASLFDAIESQCYLENECGELLGNMKATDSFNRTVRINPSVKRIANNTEKDVSNDSMNALQEEYSSNNKINSFPLVHNENLQRPYIFCLVLSSMKF